MGDTKERRRYPRIGRKYGVRYRIVGGRDDAEHVGMVVNLSQGGVVIVSKRPLDAGTLLHMEFPESIFGGPRTLNGKIVWIHPQDGEVLIGCQFVRMGDTASRPKPGDMKPEPVVATGRERRRFQRWEQKLHVKLRCVTPGPFEEKGARDAMLRDVSKGGVEVVTTREYVKNLILEMQFPESALGPAQTYHVRILRSSGCDKPGQFALGCAFVKVMKSSR